MSTTLALALQLTAINGVSGVLSRIKNDILNLGNSSAQVKRDFDAMNASISKGLQAVAAYSYLKAKMQPGVRAAADLQEAMLAVEGNIAKSTDSAADLANKLKEVRQTAVDISKAAPYSAKEVVEIQGALLKAGVEADAVMGKRGAAWAAAGLATVSGVAPDQVGDMLARIGKQFDFQGKDYKPSADILMRAESASPGNLQEIMYSLKQFGATAKLLNVSFKDSATISAAMAPLGLESGTAINRFILDSAGLTKHQRESMLKLGLAQMHDGKFENKLYKDGKYIGLEAQIKMMREAFDKIKGDNVKAKLAHDIWGQEGMRTALMAGTGKDIFSQMREEMETSLSLEERMEIRMRGFNMAAKAAAGTIQTTLATAFDPMLDKLTQGANLVNDLADAAGKAMQNHPSATAIGGGAAGIGLAGIAGYGIYQMLKGGFHGMRMVNGLVKGATSTAVGVAEGKALQAAAGVTPVFVVNMPKDGVAGASSTGAAAEVAAGAAAPGLLKKLATGARLLFAAPSMTALSSLGTGAMASAAGMVGAAGLAGYGAGSLYYKSIEGTDIADKIGGTIATILANFGNKEAERALEVNLSIDGQQVAAVVNGRNERQARRH